MRVVFVCLVFISFLSGQAFAAPTACELVSSEEMSGILGSTVAAAADGRGGQTKCTYEAAGAELGGPYAEVQLNWGDGASGLAGADAMESHLGDAMGQLAGLGDQATTVGPMILIRRNEDLITLVISGVRDPAAVAKRIYALLDARLPKSAAP